MSLSLILSIHFHKFLPISSTFFGTKDINIQVTLVPSHCNHHHCPLTQLVITVIFLLIQQLAFDDSPDAYYSNPIYVLLDQYMVDIIASIITMLILLKLCLKSSHLYKRFNFWLWPILPTGRRCCRWLCSVGRSRTRPSGRDHSRWTPHLDSSKISYTGISLGCSKEDELLSPSSTGHRECHSITFVWHT